MRLTKSPQNLLMAIPSQLDLVDFINQAKAKEYADCRKEKLLLPTTH
jgi:hypothetical protein